VQPIRTPGLLTDFAWGSVVTSFKQKGISRRSRFQFQNHHLRGVRRDRFDSLLSQVIDFGEVLSGFVDGFLKFLN